MNNKNLQSNLLITVDWMRFYMTNRQFYKINISFNQFNRNLDLVVFGTILTLLIIQLVLAKLDLTRQRMSSWIKNAIPFYELFLKGKESGKIIEQVVSMEALKCPIMWAAQMDDWER
ncbi:hypothetical protein LOAG_05002 [Loa loa]|uniref:Uncharacterized protein n=1 Tax=Loa loa TaxID=7209 RepID=A0A1S0U0Z6_LOALO|nr:hypothetical protein LOAG_05002 [Loa loa]EFO23488.1 hypothetical protein LOAG_05002 [Loa loa]